MKNEDIIRVLIADDEDRFRVTTAATLKNRGFRVTAVGSGFEAVEEVRKGKIDVAILDVKMPGMDGHEALREIKKIDPGLEVIMLTGYGALGSALEGWHEGVFAYLTKPSGIDFLAERIRDAYKKKRGEPAQTRRVKDIMEPPSTFFTAICENQSVAEAIELMRRFFDKAISATRRREALLRCMLVTDERDKIIGVISLVDLLRGLQPSCMGLSEDRCAEPDSVYLDAHDYLGNFPTMVRRMASKKVRELMPEKPPTIGQNADLIEVANRMLSLRVPTLLVVDDSDVLGVVRDKDLFLEMARVLRDRDSDTAVLM